ncbi:MAG: PilZ domain-containing protein [Phycisphaerae bacterium]|nr:PilZ domain-containing protein [Phycisphaerae bacterium]
MVSAEERRTHPRYDIDWPVSIRPSDRARVFGGRGQNLSRCGALVALPLSIPIRPGQRMEVKLRASANPAMPEAPKDDTAEVRSASVVRVQRGTCFLDGLQLVGLEFED